MTKTAITAVVPAARAASMSAAATSIHTTHCTATPRNQRVSHLEPHAWRRTKLTPPIRSYTMNATCANANSSPTRNSAAGTDCASDMASPRDGMRKYSRAAASSTALPTPVMPRYSRARA